MRSYKAYDHCLVVDLTSGRYAIIYDDCIEVWIEKKIKNKKTTPLTYESSKCLVEVISNFKRYRYELQQIREDIVNNIVVLNHVDHEPKEKNKDWERVLTIKDIIVDNL